MPPNRSATLPAKREMNQVESSPAAKRDPGRAHSGGTSIVDGDLCRNHHKVRAGLIHVVILT
jgi:hypothetical protein